MRETILKILCLMLAVSIGSCSVLKFKQSRNFESGCLVVSTKNHVYCDTLFPLYFNKALNLKNHHGREIGSYSIIAIDEIDEDSTFAKNFAFFKITNDTLWTVSLYRENQGIFEMLSTFSTADIKSKIESGVTGAFQLETLMMLFNNILLNIWPDDKPSFRVSYDFDRKGWNYLVFSIFNIDNQFQNLYFGPLISYEMSTYPIKLGKNNVIACNFSKTERPDFIVYNTPRLYFLYETIFQMFKDMENRN